MRTGATDTRSPVQKGRRDAATKVSRGAGSFQNFLELEIWLFAMMKS